MPILILGALVVAGLLVYMFITGHKEKFVRSKEEANGPFDVIYLPADLDEEKKKDAARRAAADAAKKTSETDSSETSD